MINNIISIFWLQTCNDNIVSAHPRLGKGTVTLPQSLPPLQILIIINKNITITIIAKTHDHDLQGKQRAGPTTITTNTNIITIINKSTSSQQEHHHQYHLQGKRRAGPKDTRGGGSTTSTITTTKIIITTTKIIITIINKSTSSQQEPAGEARSQTQGYQRWWRPRFPARTRRGGSRRRRSER